MPAERKWIFGRRASSSRRSLTTLRSRGRRARFALIAAGALFAAALLPCTAATYSGTLTEPGVVWISDTSKPATLPESEMRNTHKSFVPDELVITVGSSVRFPNDDEFFHSIYSEGPPDPFDIGFYDTGPGKSVVFTNPGVVLIRCHIHGPMHATIIVVDGPWAQTHEPNVKYTLENVHPGNHALHVWSALSGEKSIPVRV